MYLRTVLGPTLQYLAAVVNKIKCLLYIELKHNKLKKKVLKVSESNFNHGSTSRISLPNQYDEKDEKIYARCTMANVFVHCSFYSCTTSFCGRLQDSFAIDYQESHNHGDCSDNTQNGHFL